jgi:hypothetical protein
MPENNPDQSPVRPRQGAAPLGRCPSDYSSDMRNSYSRKEMWQKTIFTPRSDYSSDMRISHSCKEMRRMALIFTPHSDYSSDMRISNGRRDLRQTGAFRLFQRHAHLQFL